jgi:soluble lytic murein transglycosylase
MGPRRIASFLDIRALIATLGAGCVFAGDLGSPFPASAIPGPEAIERADEAERVPLLLSFGLDREAERRLRARIEGGDSEARGPLLHLLVRRGRPDEAGRLLDAWGGPDSLGGPAILFTAARIREREERWEEAAAHYGKSASREPLLADHAAYRAGLALEEVDRHSEALELYETAAASGREADLASRASWRAAGLALRQGQNERALRNLERIPARSVIAREDLLELEADIYRDQGNTEREARVLREILDRAPTSRRAVGAIERLSELAEPSVEDRLVFAETSIRNRHATLGESQARLALEMLEESPDPVLAGKARLWLGKALVRQKRLTEARRVLAEMPVGADPEDLAEALLDRARCLWKLGQVTAALAEFDRVFEGEHPEDARKAAAWEAAREAKDNRRWWEAALRMDEFRNAFPDDEYADDALWHRGRALAELGEDEKAVSAFETLRGLYPESAFLEEGIYWIANLHRAANREEDACNAFATLLAEHADSYWAARAREVLRESPCAFESDSGSLSEEDAGKWLAERFPDVDAEDSRRAAEILADSESFRRAALLGALDLVPEAESALSGLRRSLGGDPAALVAFAEGAWRLGIPRAGMRAMTVVRALGGLAILSGQTPAPVARLLYPVEHLDSVLRWSAEYDLDPLFVFAVMREESWFDSRAVSWVGARGLLQIMPSTGRDLARRVGLQRFDRADLFDPDLNIRLGSFYLRALLDELDREPALALSAYNAGKGNALRWKKGLDGDFDVDRYVAGISYLETYNYVQRVTRTYAIYRHLYGELVPRLGELHGGESGDASRP